MSSVFVVSSWSRWVCEGSHTYTVCFVRISEGFIQWQSVDSYSVLVVESNGQACERSAPSSIGPKDPQCPPQDGRGTAVRHAPSQWERLIWIINPLLLLWGLSNQVQPLYVFFSFLWRFHTIQCCFFPDGLEHEWILVWSCQSNGSYPFMKNMMSVPPQMLLTLAAPPSKMKAVRSLILPPAVLNILADVFFLFFFCPTLHVSPSEMMLTFAKFAKFTPRHDLIDSRFDARQIPLNFISSFDPFSWFFLILILRRAGRSAGRRHSLTARGYLKRCVSQLGELLEKNFQMHWNISKHNVQNI